VVAGEGSGRALGRGTEHRKMPNNRGGRISSELTRTTVVCRQPHLFAFASLVFNSPIYDSFASRSTHTPTRHSHSQPHHHSRVCSMSYYGNAPATPHAPRMGTIPLPLQANAYPSRESGSLVYDVSYARYLSPPASPAPVTPRSLPPVVAASPSYSPRSLSAYPSPSSSATTRPLPGVVALNAHIQHYPGHPPQTVWDVRTAPANAQNSHRQLLDLNMPACTPPVPELVLCFAMSPAPAPVRVLASNGRFVAVRDVLSTIYNVLAAPIDANLHAQLSHLKASRLAGGRVAHLLETSVRFLGLRQVPSAPQTFEVLFGPQ